MKEQITEKRKLESSLVLTTLHEDSCNVKSGCLQRRCSPVYADLWPSMSVQGVHVYWEFAPSFTRFENGEQQ